MKLLKQKKKDRTFLIKIVLLVICLWQNIVFAEDFFLPDLGISRFQKVFKITKNTNSIVYEQVRRDQSFDNFFDKQVIIIHKNLKDLSPKAAGNIYLQRMLQGDRTSEKYIIENSDNNFEAVFCSKKLKRCEIIRFYQGYNGLIATKYIHNNTWHFQNNIGSFVAIQRAIRFYPVDFISNSLYDTYGTARIRL